MERPPVSDPAPPPTALGQAAAIKRAEVSATEVLEAHLAALDRIDPVLNCVAFRDDERARVDARAVDDAVAAGRADDLGPFAGVPMLIKDLNDVAGWPTTFASKASDGSPRPADSLPVARLRSAGFVFSGKSTTPEFGTIPVTESDRLGRTRNPWDPDHTPGGSSGGAAAAVAAGALPVAHASDGGGSIRIPSSCCGLVGLKPSRHRVTNDVTTMIAASTQGVVARTVADQAAVLDVMAGPDRGAWEVAPPLARPLAAEVGTPPGRLRVRVTVGNMLGIPPAPACRAAVESAAGLLEELGHHVEWAEDVWPDPVTLFEGFLTVWSTISAAYPLTDPSLLEPHNAANRDKALATSAIDYSQSVMELQRATRSFVAPFGTDIDLMLTPTLAIEPPEVGWIWRGVEDDPMAPLATASPMGAYTAVFNVTGQPAVSVPVGTGETGLPVGVQLVAPLFDEATLVRVAAQLEEAVGWAERPPPPVG